jgi:hypothetical protein
LNIQVVDYFGGANVLASRSLAKADLREPKILECADVSALLKRRMSPQSKGPIRLASSLTPPIQLKLSHYRQLRRIEKIQDRPKYLFRNATGSG